MFRAIIKDGRLSFGPIILRQFEEFLDANDGKNVTIELDKPGRSSSQNRYYWTYLEVIARETGDNADDLHEFFKRKLLPPVFKTIRGEEMKLPASTTDLNKNDFTEYLDKIAALTLVPLPDPIQAGYLPH
jgi:hypothetical protein